MIDVIIPIYNSKKTLPYTLMSLRIQKNIDDINIILVDDKSTDDYTNILNEFSDLNIKYLRLKENVGSGKARQIGLENSSSKYVMFIDSDDILFSSYAIKKLYDEIENDLDFVCGLTYDIKNDYLIANNGSLHGKIYRRSFIESNNIRFNNTRFHEDNYFNNLFLLCNPKIKYTEEIVYIYTYNKDSITNIDDKEFERLEILISNIKELINEASKRNISNELLEEILKDKRKYLKRIYQNQNDIKKEILLSWINKYQIFDNEFILYLKKQ